jgi:DNA-directed RNA polymerase subunit RPC12/RpoP
MKRFLSLLAVVVMLSILTPTYVSPIHETFVARAKEVHYRCHYCGKTVRSSEIPRAVKTKCPDSPSRKHAFGSCGRW